MMFKTQKNVSEELSVSNRIFFSPQEWNQSDRFVNLKCNSRSYIFRSDVDDSVINGFCSMGVVQRRWVYCGVNELIECVPFNLNSNQRALSAIKIELGLFQKNKTVSNALNTDKLAEIWYKRFADTPMTLGQQILFTAEGINFEVSIKSLKVVNLETHNELPEDKMGVFLPTTEIKFCRKEESHLILEGNYQDEADSVALIKGNWDFNSIGVGGIDKQFAETFRRVFVSRLLPPDLVEQLNMKHVRGILLYGPPGTGKTLLARQIGKMLNSREPKIVNGPSILDKYVGESEANIRKLFAEAEDEYKKVGNNSSLHIIIFDEIDAICKARGNQTGGSQVQDTVVNQLLSKMDGVEQLNNILIIGMTNRRDLIDEALLRPGRIEVQIEISLPDEHGRKQIFDIHTKKYREHNKLASDVSIDELAALTKNFSGAEIEGLVKAAWSNAMHEKINVKNKTISDADFETMCIRREHFLYSIEHDIKPFFASRDNYLDALCKKEFVKWGEPLDEFMEKMNYHIQAMKDISGDDLGDDSSRTNHIVKETLLLVGPEQSGSSTLAVQIALQTGIQCIRMVSLVNMMGYTENSRCLAMKKQFDDALSAPSAVIILDDLESLVDYVDIGPKFSVTLVDCLLNLVNRSVAKNKKLLIIATGKDFRALDHLGFFDEFDPMNCYRVPLMIKPEHALAFFDKYHLFSDHNMLKQAMHGMQKFVPLNIGVKNFRTICEILQSVEPKHRVEVLLEKIKPQEILNEFGDDFLDQFNF